MCYKLREIRKAILYQVNISRQSNIKTKEGSLNVKFKFFKYKSILVMKFNYMLGIIKNK